MSKIAYIGADIHDGMVLHSGKVMAVTDGMLDGIFDTSKTPTGYQEYKLQGGTLCPGFVDLQVNGGGGVLFNDDPSVDTLKIIAEAHASVGTVAILPTLITDTITITKAAISAVKDAMQNNVQGIIGIHLEGPHLSHARKGAHDANLIREMSDDDLNIVLDAAKIIPNVKMTVAPESVSNQQIQTLTKGGVIVSLGHSDVSFETAISAVDNGVRCVTHLFNAMSQLTNREPGLVGAALFDDRLKAGIIADGHHIHPATMRTALAAKSSLDGFFLVSDAMATVGSKITEFTLNGRTIFRANGVLTLEDGTLAGADLDMQTSVSNMVTDMGVNLEDALAMATSVPASILNDRLGFGQLKTNSRVDLNYLNSANELVELKH
jgi:N-acetylglucosamine-6-phosphate deacetylase